MELKSTFSKSQWVTGIKQTQRALKNGIVQKVYISKSVDPVLLNPLVELCEKSSIPIEEVEDSATLGKLCGIDVEAAAAGILL